MDAATVPSWLAGASRRRRRTEAAKERSMANGVNKVILVGNLGKDPEVRYLQSGNAVCTLRLAVTERRKEGDGWKDHTEWMDVVTFGKTAENAGQYLKKGRQVYVEGRMQTRSYKDKHGVEKYRTEVVGNQLLFLGGAGGDAAPASGQRKTQTQTQQPQEDAGGDSGFVDDDLPF
jgi:single-strand DNA-binding protein